MAVSNPNTIEYRFEGNTLDLEHAVGRLNKLLRESAEQLKTYQEGTLTEQQQAQVASVQRTIRALQYVSKQQEKLSAKSAAKIKKRGAEALAAAASLSKQAQKIAAKGQADIAKYGTPLAAQRGSTQAGTLGMNLLGASALLSPEAHNQISSQLAEYRKVMDDATSSDLQRARALKQLNELYRTANPLLSQLSGQIKSAAEKSQFLRNALETLGGQAPAGIDLSAVAHAADDFDASMESANATTADHEAAVRNVNKVYEQYGSALRRAIAEQQKAANSITSINDVLEMSVEYLSAAVTSYQFWIRQLKRVVKYAAEGVQTYADYVESINFLRAATGDAADEMDRFAKTQAAAFGLRPTEINTAAAQFYSFADSMGFASEQSALVSQNLTKLSQDLASMHNVDLEDAAKKLRSALAGQSRALAVWGVNVTEANVNEWLLSKGINKTMNEMSEASQAAVRYAFILENTSTAQGDLARTIQSPANQLRILSSQLKQLQQNAGALLTTVVIPMVRTLNGLLRPINALVQGLTKIAAGSFTSSVGSGAESWEEYADGLENVSEQAAGLAGIDEINQATQGKGAGLGISDDIANMLTGYDNLAEKNSELISSFEKLGEALAPIWAIFANSEPIINFSQATEGLAGVIDFFCEPLRWMNDLIGKLPEGVQKAISKFASFAVQVLEVIGTYSIFKALLDVGPIKKLISIVGNMISIFKSLVAATWQVVASGVKMVAGWIKQGVVAAATALKNAFLSKSFWSVAIATVAAAGIAGLATAGVVAASTAIAKSAQTRSEGAVPQLATGGVTKRPTFAMIGEGRFNEAVIPLGNSPQFASMKQDIAEAVTVQLQGDVGRRQSNTPIILQLNGRELARAILPDLGNVRPQVGVRLT